MIIWLHRYFAIDVAEKETKKCEIRVHLKNKFTADIFVDAPLHHLRRINQLLPFTVEKFPTTRTEIKAMITSRYGNVAQVLASFGTAVSFRHIEIGIYSNRHIVIGIQQ